MEFIVFRPFRSGDENAFRDLNEEWIRDLFALEEKDREVLGDPETHILASGGAIFIAEEEGQAIGCCALQAMGPGTYELAKMTIAASHRGKGIGRGLLRYVIAEARKMAARRLYLETNHKLKDAIHLYRSVGFDLVPAERLDPSPYARTDVFMELLLVDLSF